MSAEDPQVENSRVGDGPVAPIGVAVFRADTSSIKTLANDYVRYELSRKQSVFILSCFALAVFILGLSLTLLWSQTTFFAVAGTVVGVVALLVISIRTQRNAVRRAYSDGQVVTLELREAGLVITGELTTSTIAYAALENVIQYRSLVLLTQKGSQIPLLLPEQLLPEPQLLRDKIAAARESGATASEFT